MAEKRVRVTYTDLFPDGKVIDNQNLKVVASAVETDSQWCDSEVTVAQYLALAFHEVFLNGSLEDIFRVREIWERFYEMMDCVEVRDEGELSKRMQTIMGDRDSYLFSDYTRGAFETKTRLAEVVRRCDLPEPKVMLVCLSYMNDNFLFCAPLMISSIKERFAEDLKGYLQFELETAEAAYGYSYGVNDQYIEGLKKRIAGLV